MGKESDSIKVIKYDDMYNDMNDYLEKDGHPGLPTCFKCLNDHYTHKQGGVTDWTGWPASGKTYFALETLMSQATRYDKRFGLFLPDLGSDKEAIQKVVKMHTGKDFNDRYQNKITSRELATSMNWIFDRFVFFKRKDLKSGITPLAFWEMVCEYKDDVGKLDGGLSDSWKNFEHVYSGREDLYLDKELSIRNSMAEDYQVHLHTIAHAVKPTTTEALNKNGQSGKRKIPTANEIKGGAAWDSNGKTIITVDRASKNKTEVDIYINKVKPEDVGKPGAIIGKIKLDPRKGRYYEIIGTGTYFAYEWQDIPVQEEIEFNSEVTASELPF